MHRPDLEGGVLSDKPTIVSASNRPEDGYTEYVVRVPHGAGGELAAVQILQNYVREN